MKAFRQLCRTLMSASEEMLALAYLIGRSEAPSQDSVMLEVADILRSVNGNRPLGYQLTQDDLRLIYAAVLRKALEIVEGDPK